MRMSKKLVVVLVMLGLIGGPAEGLYAQTVWAQNDAVKTAGSANDAEKMKADFAYEMAQLTAKIVALPNNNVIKFKVTLDSEVDQTLAKLGPSLPQDQQAAFGNEMSLIKNKAYANPKLSIEKAKADFSYDIAQVTSAFMPKVVSNSSGAAKPAFSDKVVVQKSGTESAKVNEEKAAPTRVAETQAKTDFAATMKQLAETIGALPNNNVIKFKVTLDNEVEQAVAKLRPTLPSAQQADFSNEMLQIKNRAYNNPKLNIEKAKADFSNDLAQLTTKYVGRVEGARIAAVRPTAVAQEPVKPAVAQQVGYVASPPVARAAKPITPETYTGIMNDLMTVGDGKKAPDNKVKIDGNIRYHYSVNDSSASWGRNTSGFRARIGAEAWVNPDWKFNGMVEGKQSILNYENTATFRASLTGKLKWGTLQAGSFGYFMADGNIYDSTFSGGRIDFGGPIKYTLAAGSTDDTQQTVVATARYDALDYGVEAGIYNYTPTDTTQQQNTIYNLSGMYKFSNFNVGSMILVASQKDSQGNNFGYVHSINYGEVKTWRPGTFGMFARYYYQPRFTYIAPTMNGRGGWMQGYKGIGIGAYYTVAENLVAGLEYYNLHEITTGEPGVTWWGSLTGFF